MKPKDYSTSGVDVSAADNWVAGLQKKSLLARSEKDAKLISGIGDYAAVYASSAEQWTALSCDGVGSKLLWTQEGLGTPEALAQDLVAMNANDVLCVGATPALFLDYLAVGSKQLLAPGALLDRFMNGLWEACADSEQILVGGETAQLPDLYAPHHFDLAGFCVGYMKPSGRLSVDSIEHGAQVWGWPSSGPHANGFTWLRKIYSADKDKTFISESFMKPTELYIKRFKKFRDALKVASALQASFHITGSGLLNFLRAQPKTREIGFRFDGWDQYLGNDSKSRLSNSPPWLKETARRALAQGTERIELYRTFNMGIGMALVIEPGFAEQNSQWLLGMGLIYLGVVTNTGHIEVGSLILKD